VVEDKLDDYPQAAPMRFAEEDLKIAQGAAVGMDIHVMRDVVAVVAERRRVERQEPDSSDAEILNIVELLGQACEVTDPITVTVVKRAYVKLVDDRVLVPERVARPRRVGVRFLRTHQRCVITRAK
jgi:hypothetical protein